MQTGRSLELEELLANRHNGHGKLGLDAIFDLR